MIAQVIGFRLSPAGNAGLTVQFEIVPVTEGIMLTETPTVKVATLVPVEPAVKTKLAGAVSEEEVVVDELPVVELEEFPPNRAIGKSIESEELLFFPLQSITEIVETRQIISKRTENKEEEFFI